MSKYSIGIDFGTLSARALLVQVETGEEITSSVFEYPHKVIENELPCGKELGAGWSLQDPQDYLDALQAVIRGVLEESRISSADVIGVGVDFTSCTMLPVDRNNTPLCMLPRFRSEPHAYAKLWKHHAAQYCAERIDRAIERMGGDLLHLYGGKTNSEWMLPKVMQLAEEAPQVYAACDRIVEAGDWIVWQLTGERVRSTCMAGYKSFWNYKNGYPRQDFFTALNPALGDLMESKLAGPLKNVGECAGTVTPQMADFTGLKAGTAVSAAAIDAHASLPACGISEPGKLLLVLGTSTCHIVLDQAEKEIPGICGVVKDGILPGLFAYEAGQNCVGDSFAWFVNNCVPESYVTDARAKHRNIYQYLQEKAETLCAGESGLLALDWWNGVRSTLMNYNLSGLILGLTLQTKPEEIYRALIEATAFGARKIMETYQNGGISVDELYAAGGIAAKDTMTMQIYADVCNRDIYVAGSAQSGALGSAFYGIAAAGEEKSGYRDMNEIVRLGRLQQVCYHPDPENVRVYEILYKEYNKLYACFGSDENPVMNTLKALKKGSADKKPIVPDR